MACFAKLVKLDIRDPPRSIDRITGLSRDSSPTTMVPLCMPAATSVQNFAREMQLFYATRDGQSRRIAERIAGRLADKGIPTLPHDLAAGLPSPQRLAEARLLALVAAVRYGRPLPESERLLASYRRLRAPPPLVLLSVNLTARKPGKDTAEGNVYLRKSITRHRLAPVLALAIAGRLDYARYGWLDRQLIRFIMKLTGGPTDLKTCIEYTAWNVVDEVALRIAEIYGRSGSA